jgi:hypothetical protein
MVAVLTRRDAFRVTDRGLAPLIGMDGGLDSDEVLLVAAVADPDAFGPFYDRHVAALLGSRTDASC